MAKCKQCGGYTKFHNGLCTSCYQKENHFDRYDELVETEPGLSDKDWNYRYSMIKGRIAETLIQELFLSLDFNVFRYGMENTVPGIVDLLKGVRSDVAQEIKRMPDFVIQDRRNKNVYFIEVKFRANGRFNYGNLPENYPYENAYIVLVSKKHIKCLTVNELKEGKEITDRCNNYLGSRKEFDLDKSVIIEFCNFAVQFFEAV